MKKIRISLKRFDLEALLAEANHFIKDYLSSDFDPTYEMVWVNGPGDVPIFGPESGWDVLSGLTREGKTVFIPFARSDDEGGFECADGNTYESESDPDDEDEMICGEVDTIGFLLNVKKGFLTVNSAIHAGGGCPPPPSVDLCPDCGILDEPMEEFIRGFISE